MEREDNISTQKYEGGNRMEDGDRVFGLVSGIEEVWREGCLEDRWPFEEHDARKWWVLWNEIGVCEQCC